MKTSITALFLIFFSAIALSQNCQSDNSLTGLKRGQSYTAPCDSMVVMTKPTYERLRWEDKQKAEIIRSFERSEKLLGQKAILMDSILLRYKSHTDSLNKYLSEKQGQINRLDSLVVRSTENTDKAIKIAKQNQRLAIISGSITVVLLIISIFN